MFSEPFDSAKANWLKEPSCRSVSPEEYAPGFFPFESGLPLALRAVVRGALGEQYPFDRRRAGFARLTGAPVSPVVDLKPAFCAVRIDVVGN